MEREATYGASLFRVRSLDMRRPAALVLVLGLLTASCGDDDDDSAAANTTTSTTVATTTTTTTEAPTTTTTTTAFDGSTAPTEGPATATGTALLTDVQVAPGQVTFTFREGTPGYRVGYTSDPITQDASGEPVAVEGDAHLTVRFEPSSGYDMEAEAESYTGPERVPGEDPITEVVRTGDFEAVLNWVIGLDAERAYRVEVDAPMLRVYFST